MNLQNPFSKDPVVDGPELRRIMQMPRRVWTEEQVEQITDRMTELLRTPNGTQCLRPIQALALYEMGTTGGLLGPIPVGAGKELICFLAPRVMFAKYPLLIMPAHLVKRSYAEMEEYSKNWRVATNLRITSFQLLGQASQANTLGMLPPDLFILNEAHRIKNKNAAVSRRVIRHMAQYPNAKFVAVSGTLLAKSILDFAHIARWCVKPCPLPEDYGTLLEWSEALDEKPGGWNQREPGALLKLCNEEELKNPPTVAARLGFRRRLIETPGVVASRGDDDVAHANGDPIKITVRALSYEQHPIVEQHFAKLRNEWATPSGWAFSIAMEVWRHARTLALGLHYEWDPPPPGGPDGEWVMKRKAWKKFVREQLKDSDVFDSELQVANACRKGALDDSAFNAWRAIEPSYTPSSKAVWHDDAALKVCQQWMSEGPGVVFTDHTFFALELSRRTGAPYYGAEGLDKNGNRIEDADPKSAVIASRIANSTGRNIQFWHRGLVTAPPHQALEWEQLIGRFHRTKQTKDVEIDVLLGCIEHWDGWMRSLELARMTKDTLGAPQKLLIAETQFPSALEILARPGLKWQRVQEKT